MTGARFDLGLAEEDERALGEARRARLAVDGESAFRLIASASVLVEAAVRRRPPLSGPPFVLPGHDESPEA